MPISPTPPGRSDSTGSERGGFPKIACWRASGYMWWVPGLAMLLLLLEGCSLLMWGLLSKWELLACLALAEVPWSSKLEPVTLELRLLSPGALEAAQSRAQDFGLFCMSIGLRMRTRLGKGRLGCLRLWSGYFGKDGCEAIVGQKNWDDKKKPTFFFCLVDNYW